MKPSKKHQQKRVCLAALTPVVPPTFDVNNEQELNNAKSYLAHNGYVVYSNVMTPAEIETAKALLWDYLESLGT